MYEYKKFFVAVLAKSLKDLLSSDHKRWGGKIFFLNCKFQIIIINQIQKQAYCKNLANRPKLTMAIFKQFYYLLEVPRIKLGGDIAIMVQFLNKYQYSDSWSFYFLLFLPCCSVIVVIIFKFSMLFTFRDVTQESGTSFYF